MFIVSIVGPLLLVPWYFAYKKKVERFLVQHSMLKITVMNILIVRYLIVLKHLPTHRDGVADSIQQ